MKDFEGILENRLNRKSVILNIIKASFRQVKLDLKKSGVPMNRLKKIKAVELFCDKHNIDNSPKSRKSVNRWLVDCYLDDSFKLLKSKAERSYTFSEWRNLKNKVFIKYKKECMRCESINDLTVDHIKPYSIYPELALDFDNMQILCRSCNSKKGTKIKDYRLSHSKHRYHALHGSNN